MTKIPDIIESFGFPITLVFAKNGKAYFSERMTGNLWEINGKNFRIVHTFPIVKITGHHETGLLGIALDPDFESSNEIYAFYTYGDSPEKMMNKIVKVNASGGEEKMIFDNIPAGLIHNGGIMAFAPDKTLYIGVGVQNEIMDKSQDVKWLGGKILRINHDGSIPDDNPFPNSPVYSYGHRNIFGLAFHPKTGKLYISEDGPDKDDEINIVEKGADYGWPEVTGTQNNPKFVDPIISYTPTITPTQCAFVGNDFYFASWNEGTVHKLTLGGENFDRVEKDEIVYQGKSFGVVGVFYNEYEHEFYAATPNRIVNFEPKI